MTEHVAKSFSYETSANVNETSKYSVLCIYRNPELKPNRKRVNDMILKSNMSLKVRFFYFSFTSSTSFRRRKKYLLVLRSDDF